MIPKFNWKDTLHVKRYLDSSSYNPETGSTTHYKPAFKVDGLVRKNKQSFTFDEYDLEFDEKVEVSILIPQKEVIQRQSYIFEESYTADDGTVQGIKYEVLTQEFEKNPLNDKVEYTRVGVKINDTNITLEEYLD